MKLLRLRVFAFVFSLASMAPLGAQSLQSAFSEPVFDTAKAPKNLFGDVQVDPATGHVSMQIPLGPGIGARGAVYHPMITFDQTYNHYTEDTTYNPGLDGINSIQSSCTGYGDFSKGGFCAEVLNHTDTTVSNGAFRFSPGTLDLAIPHGYRGEDNMTRFRVGALSGVANFQSVLPGNTASTDPFPAAMATSVLAKFGYDSSTVVGSVTANPTGLIPGTGPFCKLASDRYLIMALQGNAYPLQSINNEIWGHFNAPANEAYIQANLYYPQAMLVVDGDTAYEFTQAFPLNQEEGTIMVRKTYGEKDIIPVLGTLHIRYRLTRIRNAFGDEIRFAYSSDPSGKTQAIYVIQAEWWRQGADTQIGVTWSFNPASGPARYTVVYSGLRQPLSYTLAAASKPLSSVARPSMPLRMQQPDAPQLPPDPPPPSSWFDNPAAPANYAWDPDLIGINKQEETLWNAVPLDSVTQDQTQEQMAFGVTAFGVGTTVAYSKAGQAPSRAIVLHWSGEYDFLDTKGAPFADISDPRIGHSRTTGVTQVDELIAGPHGTITRATTYNRVIPQPEYTDYIPRGAPYDGCYTLTHTSTGGNVLLRDLSQSPAPIVWQNRAFTCTVTHFDGRSEKYTYQSPNLTESGLDWLVFIKALPIEEDWYGAQGGLEKTITFSNFDVHTLGNPGGSGIAPIPVATHWEIKDYLAGRWEVHDISSASGVTGVGWDATNLGWAGEQVLIKDLNGNPIADRTVGKTLTSHLNVFLYAQDKADTPNDPTVRTPVSRDGFDSRVNLTTAATYGDPSGQQIVLHSDWDTTKGLLNDAWLSDGIVTTQAFGATYGYDPTTGFMTSIAPIDPSYANLQVQQTSNGVGWPLTQTDLNGLTKTFTWDGAGRLSAEALPNGEFGHTFTYDPVALTVAVAHGVQAETHVYNGFGDPIRLVRDNGDGTKSHRAFGYDSAGRLSWETVWRPGDGATVDWTAALGPDDVYTPGQAAWVEVTNQCALWSHPDADGNTTCMRYRTINHPATVGTTVYTGSTHYTYDEHNRIVSVTNPNGETTTTSYLVPNPGLIKTVTLAPGTGAQQQQTDTYDPLGRLVKVTAMSDSGPLDSVYAYDNADRLLSVTQWSGSVGMGPSQIRTWAYDTLGRLKTLVQPESGTTTYGSFTPTGKPQTTVYGYGTAAPLTVTTAYDTQSRVIGVTSSDGSVNQGFHYSEGGHGLANGKLTRATANGVGRSLTYGGLNGRLSGLIRTVDGQSFAQSMSYDPNYGFLTSRTYPDGKVQKVGYTNLAKGLPTSTGFGAAPTPSDLVNTLGYDPTGWMLNQISYANGASSGFSYRGDQVSLKGMTHSAPTTTPFTKAFTFFYNEAGQLGSDGEDWYSYDKLGRLTAAYVNDPNDVSTSHAIWQTFGYDAFGNRNSSMTRVITNWAKPASGTQPSATGYTTSLPPAGYQLANVDFNPADIPAGQSVPELASLAQYNQLPARMANGAATGALYDAYGNLTQVATAPGATTMVGLTYDALGRVIQVVCPDHVAETYAFDDEGLRIKVQNQSTGAISYHLYDENRQLIAEYQGGAWKDMVYVGSKEVAEVGTSGIPSITFDDHLGSPRYQWDGTPTHAVVQQKFLPFGEALASPAVAAQFAKGFTNHEQTDPSGLIYMQARFYAPMYGRFLSPDPARDQHFEQTQSWNIYSYVQNDPTMKIDPTGMQVFVDGDRSKDYLAALQKNVSFKVGLSDKGQVTATVEKDQKLSKADKELLGAINDPKHTVNIHAVSQDTSVFLGRSDGAHTGSHTIAFDQASLLDQPKNAGGMTSAQLVGHETLEGYYESKGKSLERAHNAANQFFPGFSNQKVLGGLGKNGMVIGLTFTLQIQGTNITEKFKGILLNPFPQADLGTPKQPAGQNAYPVDVEVAH